MNKIYLAPEIFYIENFISKEDLDTINLYCSKTKKWMESGSFLINYFKEDEDNKDLAKKVSDIYVSFKNKIESEINNDFEEVNFTFMIQKYPEQSTLSPGWALAPHADRIENYENAAGTREDSIYVTKGYVLYFNDNYDGGEVLYLKRNIKVKPKSGMLLVHSAYNDYYHGVSEIKNGERIFTTGFVYDKKWFEENKKDRI